MKIYLLRHGQAGAGEPDALRELTAKGRADVANVVTLALNAGMRPGRVITSPLVRAKQTAEIAREICGGRWVETNALLPDAAPTDTWPVLLEEDNDPLIVGHGPHFPRMVAFLLGARASIDFKKGALMRVDIQNPGQGVLRWLITPKVARVRYGVFTKS